MPPQERWHSPASLSDQELIRMQQQAQQRVRQMQRQASEAMRNGTPQQVTVSPGRPSRPSPETSRQRHSAADTPSLTPYPAPVQTLQGQSITASLSKLLQDEDRLLILLLLVLLGSEKSDPALLLALAYLLL